MLSALPPAVILILLVLGVMLIVAWIVLPFAVIGTKPLLRRLIEESARTNALLERMAPPPAPAQQRESRSVM